MEKLTGEGPQVWPNFGEETHLAYWQLRQQQGDPIWPVLEVEIQPEPATKAATEPTRIPIDAPAARCPKAAGKTCGARAQPG